MIYVMIMLLIFSIVVLFRYYKSNYTYFVLLEIFGMNLAILMSIFKSVLMGNYQYSGNMIFTFDYRLVLLLSKIHISYYTATRLTNLGIVIFLISTLF